MNLKRFRFKWKALTALLFFVLLPGMASSENQSSASETNAASTTLDFANGLYARKMYGPALGEYEKFIKANPSSPDVVSARFRYADSCYFTKNYSGAVSGFESFIVDFPKDPRVSLALFRVGTSRYYLNDIAPAVRVFTKILTESPDTAVKSGSLFYLSKCYDARKKPEKALSSLERLVKDYPTSEYAAYAGLAVGDHQLELKRFDEALKAYQVASGQNSPPEISKEALFKMAEISFSLKDYAAARGDYSKLFDQCLNPASLPETQKKRNAELKNKALLGLFYCDYNLQDLDGAQKRTDAQKADITASPYRNEILFLFANILADKKNYDPAIQRLDEVLSDPSVTDILKEKAIFEKSSILALQDKKESSLKEIEKLFNGRSQDLGRAYFEKAEILRTMNKNAEAISNYKTVVEKYPDTDNAKTALYQAAFLEYKTGDKKSARVDFKRFAKSYPSDPNAQNALLQVVQIDLDTKNYKVACRNALAFITNYHGDLLDIAYYKLGVALTGLHEFKHASLTFQKILAKYPSSKLYAESIYGAAVTSENFGDTAGAISFYEKLTQSYPQHALTEQALVRLAYLYIQTKNYEKMNAVYQELLFNRPNVPLDTDGVFWLVRYLLNQGDYASMKKILEVLPKRFPGKNLDHEIYFFLGESSMGLKDYPKAADYYSKALAVKKDGVYAPEAYLGMGLAYEVMNDASSAETNFNEVLRYDYSLKMTMRARFEIANLRLRAGKLEEAAKGFMLVAILYDDAKYTPLSLYKAAECFAKLKQADETEKALSELKSRYPDSPWAKRFQKRSDEAAHA